MHGLTTKEKIEVGIQEDAPRRGRPRSQDARTKILQATLDICATRGFADMTIESIARLAGVGKSTIYRHWGSKAALVQEAIDREVAALNTDVDSGDLSKDLEQLLKNLVSLFASRTGKAFARLIGEAQSSDAILQLVRGHWINHREGPIVSVIVSHSKNAELRDEIDPGCISELMLGIVLLRTLIAEEPLSGEAIEEACRVILQGVARRPEPQQDN